MSAFDKREEGFEKAYALGEEHRFKALARRNKYLGLWVAERVGLTGPAAEKYARELVESLVGENDDGALTSRLREALKAQQINSIVNENFILKI